MVRIFFWSVVSILLVSNEGESARILALFPFPGKSHFNSFSTLLEELVKRGHELTVVTAYPRATPLANYTDIPIQDHLSESESEDMNIFELTKINKAAEMVFLWKVTLDNCERLFNYPQIQNLIHSNKKFDLIMAEVIFAECVYGFAPKFKVPYIQLVSNTVAAFIGNGVGNPTFFSYMPDIVLTYSDHMSFMERLHNSLHQSFVTLARNWFILPAIDSMSKKYFNDPYFPSIREIETNASFLLVNSHVPIFHPRPFTPNTAEVGGLHIRQPKKLPEELQKYLDDAPHGIIYFSLGSVIRAARMPQATRNAFFEAFSQLKQDILWKWEEESLPGMPPNVRIQKWVPQNDVLAHPNVKVFITHCGLLSTIEATYHGVPLLAIPFVGDQQANAHRAQTQGYAVVLDAQSISSESLSSALNAVLTETSYADNARRASRILKDQPQKPLDTAVYWVEYVLRHNGAPHMRSAALDLNFFQYYLLDVLAVVIICSLTVVAITVISCKSLFRRMFSESRKPAYVGSSRKDK